MTTTQKNANAPALSPEEIQLLLASMSSTQLAELTKKKKVEENIKYYEHEELEEQLLVEYDTEIEDKEKKYKLNKYDDWRLYIKKNPEVQEDIFEWIWEGMNEGCNEYGYFNVKWNIHKKEDLIEKKNNGGGSYSTGDRKKATQPSNGCNFRMKDGEVCGGETTGKAKCMCRRHNGNLHLDITQRGIYPLIDSEGFTMDKDNKKKVKATNKEFMLPEDFLNFKEGGKINTEDLKRNPLLYVLHTKGFYNKINKEDREKRAELFNMYNSKDKATLYNIFMRLNKPPIEEEKEEELPPAINEIMSESEDEEEVEEIEEEVEETPEENPDEDILNEIENIKGDTNNYTGKGVLKKKWNKKIEELTSQLSTPQIEVKHNVKIDF